MTSWLDESVGMVARELGIRWRPGYKKPVPEVDARCRSRTICNHDEDGEYRMRGGCSNCGSELIGVFTRGHSVLGGMMGKPCPVCGCARCHWDRLA